MTHREFLQAYRQGEIKVQIDPVLAGKYLSARLLLPVIVTPVIGLGAALAIWGFIWAGILLVIFGIALPRIIKMSAPRFLWAQILEDENVYNEVVRSRIMTVKRAGE